MLTFVLVLVGFVALGLLIGLLVLAAPLLPALLLLGLPGPTWRKGDDPKRTLSIPGTLLGLPALGVTIWYMHRYWNLNPAGNSPDLVMWDFLPAAAAAVLALLAAVMYAILGRDHLLRA